MTSSNSAAHFLWLETYRRAVDLVAGGAGREKIPLPTGRTASAWAVVKTAGLEKEVKRERRNAPAVGVR
jgi:hypothetical protein